ncbi:MAG: phosphoribosylglycinamide formyltransferase [Thermoanaerobaculia bacterium]
MKRLAVLLSGRGSNFLAIQKAIAERRIDAEIAAVISNVHEAPGLVKARELGLPSWEVDHRSYASREDHENAVLAILHRENVDLIALAGYMRLLSEKFVREFRNRILNIHPSLLPSFPGTNAQKQAFEYGVKISGCTVHFVDETLDGGPILVQRAVPLLDVDTTETAAARILAEEHEAYVEALAKICSREFRIEGRRVTFR